MVEYPKRVLKKKSDGNKQTNGHMGGREGGEWGSFKFGRLFK